ncbi:phospholipase D-like domain-containing protein [Opitutus terrae]|uniref:phospholipase D-like domain-containing protein n=1 Tax=Opitutus terrae TaxID=107709 RepID=UPI00192C9890|nr:phospholipase D-like domain-containing protein [Opitutus terrae]
MSTLDSVRPTPAGSRSSTWATLEDVRDMADHAFSRSAGAPLITGNAIRLLRDARENYPAWLEAIRSARRRVHFENYIIADDRTGNTFAEALIERATAGVSVRLIYDWLGAFGKSSRAFRARLAAGGVEVRCYNPPRLESPLGWVSRDHRKLLTVDGEVGFVSGLCVADLWLGDPLKDLEPWRDTGVEIRGPAVTELERAFGRVWAMLGAPLPAANGRTADENNRPGTAGSTAAIAPVGDVAMRIVASEPATSGTYRLDQLVVAFARQRVWLTDAYYLGAPTYVQALITSARDGVDVRMLFTRASDVPLLKVVSRIGYRPLLEAGVRIFEWNGSVLHAKTAVIDRRWSRVGSTNLNLASWMGNCELDAVVEDEGFAHQMEQMFEQDLANATEIVLEARRRIRANAAGTKRHARDHRHGSGRAAASAARIGNVLGAALMDRRVIEPVERRTLLGTGAVLLGLAVLFVVFPRVLAYPAGALLLWIALTLLYRGWRLRRPRSSSPPSDSRTTSQ